jgi:hypothetical protein
MGNSHSTRHQKALRPPEDSLHNNNNNSNSRRSTVVPMNSRNVNNAHHEEEEEEEGQDIPQTMNRPQNSTSGKDLSSAASPNSTVNFSDQPVDSGSHTRGFFGI